MKSIYKLFLKYLFLFWLGGSFYVTLEVIWREKSHWTMLVLAGLVFIIIGLLNELWDWYDSLLKQIIAGTSIATVAEFICGYIVNIWLCWNVWNYADMKWNILGQICPQYILLWIPIVLLAILLDDFIRYFFFDEERPYYNLF